MILIGVIGMILTLLLRQTLQVEQTQAQGFNRMLQSKALAVQFRADVGQADRAPEQWRQYLADSHSLILQMKNGDHVVYLWQKGKLLRFAFEGDEESEQTIPLDAVRVGVEFARADSNPKLLRLRLLAMRGESPVQGQTLEIAAALGGDWR